MIYTRFSDLVQAYHGLESGDVFVGQVPSSYLKPVLLTDLAARGVRLIPSAIAQMLNASKTAQALVLQPWMVPNTMTVTRRKELVDALGDYQRRGIETAVTKSEGLHCGHGVRKWTDLEILYSCIGLDKAAYPFVLQPFVERFLDVRVVLVEGFHEAYARRNPVNFRQNLACGGRSEPFDLSSKQIDFCRRLLKRTHMPFAHIDLMITDDGVIHLSEIRLNGGIHGARISRRELGRLKRNCLETLARQAQDMGDFQIEDRFQTESISQGR